MSKKIFIILTIGCGLWGCSQSLYIPASPDAKVQQQLTVGRTIYVEHCGSCHNLYRPKDFSAVQWQKNLNEMQQRANVTDAQKQLVYKYLTSQP